MSIEKLNPNLPLSDKITQLNDMIVELYGLVWQGKFDVNEMDNVYQMYGSNRRFLRNQDLGHSLSTYTGWTHLKAEDGYSIWKYTPTRYAYNSLNAMYFDDKKLTFMGEASTETANAFTQAWLYNGDSGPGYTDITAECGTETGTEFDLMTSAEDYLYVGLDTIFEGIKFEFQTRASGQALKVEYYDTGTGWTELTHNLNDYVDNTSNFDSDGIIEWTAPIGWGTVAVNSVSKYYIRISTTENPVTIAKAYYIIPSNSVPGILALSSAQILNQEWAWCSYGTAVYVTIRNSGNTSYEGDYYIASSSSSVNKQNYFIYNHKFSADYQDSAWISETINIADTSLGHTIDGGGMTVITGRKGTVVVPFECEIKSWILLADALPGDATLDIWKGTVATYPTTSGDTIIGSGGIKPYLSSERTRIGTDLTGWDVNIAENDVLTFNVDNCVNLIRINVVLIVRKK